ncbi:MAG: 50S ribosomal protein L4 [Clostridia bacterium]|nr:50S ribosomal protein L4 [Clostridia bacterium]MBR2878180.1 50S ribosomal protein L4 [Clostridia bacterium]
MPNVAILNMAGENVGTMDLADGVFGIEVNEAVLHQVVVNYLANQRQGTQSTKTRTEVRGGGRKPWRQKGTGRARQGSIRAPQWTGGGVALGPKPRDYRYTLNKKVKRLAMKSALSAKVQSGEIIVLDNIVVDEIKTKTVADMLKNINAAKKALIVLPEKNDNIYLSARNIEGVETTFVNTLNVYSILKYDSMVVTKDAVAKIEEVYA